MSRHGVWQLGKLSLRYCEFSGSSRGAREFVDKLLPELRQQCPELEVTTALRPGRHPYLQGSYRSGNERVVDVKNTDAAEILRQATVLRNSAGRRTGLKVKQRHVRPKIRNPDGTWSAVSSSVQGSWQPGLLRQQQQ